MSTSSEPTATLQPGQSIKPVVSLNQAKHLIKEHFGLEVGKIKELNSYDDRNFYVETSGDGGQLNKFIFKVLNSMDSRKTDHIEAQHGIMFYLFSKGVQCPVPYKTLEETTFKVVQIPREDVENANQTTPVDVAKEPMHLIRLLAFVEGDILYNVPISAKLLNKTGAYIAEIELMLKKCKYPVLETFSSIWILGNVMNLSKFLYVIEDKPDKFKLVQSVLTAYKNNVEPLVATLEKGVVHGDYNEQNILVRPSGDGDYDISGIIDFGDVHVGPYVFELAITVCYMMMESVRCGVVDPFDSVGYVVAGYAKIRQVPQIELTLLRTLVACRLCQSLVMGAYTYSQDPGNEYLLTTASRGWKLLDQIWNNKSDDQMLCICKQFL